MVRGTDGDFGGFRTFGPCLCQEWTLGFGCGKLHWSSLRCDVYVVGIDLLYVVIVVVGGNSHLLFTFIVC